MDSKKCSMPICQAQDWRDGGSFIPRGYVQATLQCSFLGINHLWLPDLLYDTILLGLELGNSRRHADQLPDLAC